MMRSYAIVGFVFVCGLLQGAGFAWVSPDAVSLVPERYYVRLDAPDPTSLRLEPQGQLDPNWNYEWTATHGTVAPDFSWCDFSASSSTEEPGYALVTVAVKDGPTIVATRSATLLLFKQFIILKSDDLDRLSVVPPGPTNWQYYFSYLKDEKHLKTSSGIISQNLDPAYYSGTLHPQFVAFCQGLKNSRYVEFYHHGLDHSASPPDWYEFMNQPYAWQKQHLDQGQLLSQTYLGASFTCFGAPYNSTDATTTTVMNEALGQKVWFFGPDTGYTGLVLDRNGGEIETTSGVPDFDFFLHSNPSYPQYHGYSTAPVYVVLQHHPGFQSFRDGFDQFRLIIDYLLGLKSTFIQPTEYYELVTNGVLPADPQTQPPQIVTQPISQTVNPAVAVSFSVAASGADPLVYQWKKNNVAIPGATASTYTITAAQQGDEGDYVCAVSNPVGNVASNAATLLVNDPPSITTQPASVTVGLGAPTTFTVGAAGTAPLSYQWRKSASDIPGATDASYTISSVTEQDQGLYSCYVSNEAGAATGQNVVSASASLTVMEATAIIADPVSQTVDYGTSVQFIVMATGVPAPSYQWRKGGVDIANATLHIFTLPAPANADEGSYDCRVTNPAGSAPSGAATLTVRDPAILAQPANQILLAGVTAEFHVGAGGTGLLAYQWYRQGTPSTPLADGGDISGASTDTLHIANLETADQGDFYCDVTGEDGMVSSNAANLLVSDPAITLNPISRTVNPAEAVQFVVAAAGTSPFTYQWLKNGEIIAGTTTDTYTIAAAAESDEGIYACVVTNANLQFVHSNAATLVVNDPPEIGQQPASQSVDPTDAVTFTVVLARGTAPVSYQWLKGGVSVPGVTDNVYHIESCGAGDADSYACEIANMAGSTTSATVTLTLNPPPIITGDPASATIDPGHPVTFTVAASSPTPLRYQWRKNGANLANATQASLTIPSVAESDEGAYVCVVSNSSGDKTGLNPISNPASLTVNDPPVIVTQPQSATIVPGYGHEFTISAAGTPPLHYQWRKNEVDIPSATDTTYSIDAVSGQDQGTYSCFVYNTAGNVASTGATLTLYAATAIVEDPVSQSVNVGVTVDFHVAATGTPPLYYQWRKDNQTLVDAGRISGTETATLQIADGLNEDEGVYRCYVSNVFGGLYCQPASLTVYDPAIITQPVDQIVLRNHTAIFGVVAVGSTLQYQWFKGLSPLADAGNVSGSSTSTLTIGNCLPQDTGTYYCLLHTGVDPDVVTREATLTVSDPAILVHPISQTVDPGDPVTFSVLLDPGSTPDVVYQWLRDNTAIPGASGVITGAHMGEPIVYAIPSAAASDEGVYVCALTGIDTVSTVPASLSVNDPPVVGSVVVNPSTHVYPGNVVTFSLNLASGTQPCSYAWRKEGIALQDNGRIVGSASALLTINGIEPSDEGHYVCGVTNTAGSAVSESVWLIVGDVLAFTQSMQDQRTYEGEQARFEVHTFGGRGPLQYQWTFDDGQKARHSVGGNAPVLIIPQAAATDAGDYWCAVSDLRTTYYSNTATLSIAPVLAILGQPRGGAGMQNGPFTFSVAASGGFQPLSYAWRKEGSPAVLGTNASYTIPACQPEDAGGYYVVVSDDTGTPEQSETAWLTVTVGVPAFSALGAAVLAGFLAIAGVKGAARRNR